MQVPLGFKMLGVLYNGSIERQRSGKQCVSIFYVRIILQKYSTNFYEILYEQAA
jgi:hypothetical protein